MKPEKTYRINGFEQIKAFYSWVFNNPDKARPTHVSLYLFLVNQANRSNWAEWFKCPYDLAMQGACIGNNGTYYKCLDELQQWGLIKYQKGINNYKAPLINLICLYNIEQLTEQVTVPLSEQVTEQLTEQLPVHIYKLITNNLKPLTDNFNEFEKFVKRLSDKNKPKSYGFIDTIIEQFVEAHGSYEIINNGKERAAAAKLLQIYKKKFPNADSEETLQSLRAYFNACVNIGDPWLHDNMSLSIIISKFNEINNYLKNGKHKGAGATDAELIELFATKYGIKH